MTHDLLKLVDSQLPVHPHELGKLHLEAALSELEAKRVEDCLYHLALAKSLLRPESHRHPEIADLLLILSNSPDKVYLPMSSHPLELAPDSAVQLLTESLNGLDPSAIPFVHRVFEHGNFWEVEALFTGTTSLRLVSITYGSPGAAYPLLYELVEYYSGASWKRASFAGCLRKIEYLARQ